MTHKQLWKFLQFKDGKIVSDRDSSGWEIGEWREVPAPTELCKGLNACYEPLDALGYVAGKIIAKVEYKGEIVTDDNKVTTQYMRIVTAWHWEKRDSVALAVYAANLALKYFEQQYPNDKRPRLAIEAAQAWLDNPTKAARSAARSAAESAARSAESAAWSAAWSAARSAESAAWSAAESAARSAARSAESAARSAESAAWSAARKQINTWIKKHTKELEIIL